MKISRAVATAAIAGALALAPTAAFGYGASDYTNTGTLSDTTPALGESFTITVVGPANTPVMVTLTSNPASIPDAAMQLAGTRSLTKTTNASGVSIFTVTLSQPGTYTGVVTDVASGAVLSTQTVVIAAPTAAAAAATGTRLSATGSNAVPIALGAGALLLVGAGGVVYAKKRRQVAQV
jgi:LPXTG-motif cell wall-anchored protein